MMTFSLDKVVPWGRSFDEYVSMFALSPADLSKRLLGCGDGPASFNAVLTARGGAVVSVDPVYRFSAAEIRKRIGETCEEVIAQATKNKDEFRWDRITSIERLRELRMTAMEAFLSNFPLGKCEGRYLDASLPSLPFEDSAFELALCSHYLFLYSEQVGLAEHIESIKEMCRVAGEARIFPLLELGSRLSRHIAKTCDALREAGYSVAIRTVDYEFQRGGNQMMVVIAQDHDRRYRRRDAPLVAFEELTTSHTQVTPRRRVGL